MKKISIALISIYLTLTTVCTILFGALYFTQKTDDGSMTLADARNLVDTVCYDLGFITKDQLLQEDNSVSSQALPTQPFEDNTLTLGENVDIVDTNLHQWLIFARKALAEEVKENVLYTSSATISIEQSSWDQDGYFIFNINKNKLHFNILIFNEKDSGDYVAFCSYLEFIKTSSNQWDLNVYAYPANTDLNYRLDYTVEPGNLSYFHAAADQYGDLYRIAMYDLDTSNANLTDIKANEINEFYIRAYDTIENIKIEATKSSIEEADLLEQVNGMADMFNSYKTIHNFTSLANAQESDFLQSAYEEIGIA